MGPAPRGRASHLFHTSGFPVVRSGTGTREASWGTRGSATSGVHGAHIRAAALTSNLRTYSARRAWARGSAHALFNPRNPAGRASAFLADDTQSAQERASAPLLPSTPAPCPPPPPSISLRGQGANAHTTRCLHLRARSVTRPARRSHWDEDGVLIPSSHCRALGFMNALSWFYKSPTEGHLRSNEPPWARGGSTRSNVTCGINAQRSSQVKGTCTYHVCRPPDSLPWRTKPFLFPPTA